MTGSSPIRILTVDDHPVVRDGITGLVGVQPDMTLAQKPLTVAKRSSDSARTVRT
jgi:DNA-binding NarL/FixJ family response regulator